MHPTDCPICRNCKAKSKQSSVDYFECDICDGFYIDPRLVRAPTQLDDYTIVLGAIREMRDRYEWAPTLEFDGTVTCPDQDSVIHELTEFPRTVSEKSGKLLAALAKRTTYFGEIVTLDNSDYGLGYAKTDRELRAFLDFLEEQGKITRVNSTMHTVGVKVSADVFDAKAKTATEAPIEVCEMRILFLAANPMTTSSLDLEEELRSLQVELRGATHRDKISCVAFHAVRPDDLIRHVRDAKPNVIHFSGHGDLSGIVLREDSGKDTVVSGSALERFLKDRGVELVVLNSCYSEHQASSIKNSVNTVVGTTDAVDDEAARRFTAAFYRALGNGLSIQEAFRDGGDAVELHGLVDVFHCDGDLNQTLVG